MLYVFFVVEKNIMSNASANSRPTECVSCGPCRWDMLQVLQLSGWRYWWGHGEGYAPYNTYYARYTVAWPLKKCPGVSNRPWIKKKTAHSAVGNLQDIQVRTSTHQVRSRTSKTYTWYYCTAALSICIFYTSTHGWCNFLLGEESLLFSLRVRTPADDITAATRILTTRVPGIS